MKLSNVSQAFRSALRRWDTLPPRLRFLAVVVPGFGAVAVVAALLLSGDQRPDCSPSFCLELLGPEGAAVEPMTPLRIRLRGDVDPAAAIEALRIEPAAPGKAAFEDD